MKYKQAYCTEDWILMSIYNKPLVFKKGKKYFILPCYKGPYEWSYHHIMGESEKCVVILDEENTNVYSPITLSDFYRIFEYGGKITRFLRKIKDKLLTYAIVDLYRKKRYGNSDMYMCNEIVIEYKKNIIRYKVYSFANKVVRLGTYRKEKYIFGGK